MDQKIRTAGGYFVTYVCISCGLMMGVLGFAMLSDDNEVPGMIATLMLISSALLLFGGISNYRTTKRGAERAKRELEQVKKMIRQAPATVIASKPSPKATQVASENEPPNILAHWTYSAQEWQQFMGWEKKERKFGHFIEAWVIVAFGTMMLMYGKGEGWMLSLSLSLFIAIIYWLGKNILSKKSLGEIKNKGEIVITEAAIIINGKYNSFRDELYWLQKVKINEDVKPEVFIIEYGWQTRHGNTFEEIRIPIPAGRLSEAQEIQRTLLSPMSNVQNVEVSDTTEAS